MPRRIAGAVSSSEASSRRLAGHGIPVLDLNSVDGLDVYVDGADEATRGMHLIKGGGAALTREKIVAGGLAHASSASWTRRSWWSGSESFPCRSKSSRWRAPTSRANWSRLGGQPVWRQGVVTDNGCDILDVRGLDIVDPVGLERAINQIPGVVTNGLFAQRGADVLVIGTDAGVQTLRPSGR